MRLIKQRTGMLGRWQTSKTLPQAHMRHSARVTKCRAAQKWSNLKSTYEKLSTEIPFADPPVAVPLSITDLLAAAAALPHPDSEAVMRPLLEKVAEAKAASPSPPAPAVGTTPAVVSTTPVPKQKPGSPGALPTSLTFNTTLPSSLPAQLSNGMPTQLLQEYTSRSAKLFEDCQSLQKLGVQATLAVPTIIVGGDRGSGKSHMVHWLCGLDMPRGDLVHPGSRCPLEIHLIKEPGPLQDRRSSGGDRAADGAQSATSPHLFHVKLRHTHDPVSGAPLPQALTIPFGPPVLEQQHVLEQVLKAQAALLNPDRPISDYLDYLPIDPLANQLQLTRNAVVLEVYGAAMNLRIIDLPGLMPYQLVEKQGMDEVVAEQKLLKDVTADYLKRMPGAALVAVTNCSTDVAHQDMLDLARRVDPEGARTVAALTHADSPQARQHMMQLRDLLSGRMLPLKQGYFLLEPPADSPAAAAGEGAAAGSQAAPTSTSVMNLLAADAARAGRLGSPSLGHILSGLVLNQLTQQMPTLLLKVNDKLAVLESQLHDMTPLAEPEQLSRHARTQLRALTRSFEDAVRGSSSSSTGPQQSRQLMSDVLACYRKFGRQIVATRPRFQLADAPTSPGGASRLAGDAATWAALAGSPGSNLEPLLAPYGEEDQEGDPLWQPDRQPAMIKYTIDDVKRLMSAERKVVELAVLGAPSEAATAIVRQFQSAWAAYAYQLVDQVGTRMMQEMVQHVDQHFGKHPRFADVIKGYGIDLVSVSQQMTRQHVATLISMELGPDNPPFTMLDQHIRTLQDVLEKTMTDARALSYAQPASLPVEERATKVEAVRQLLRELGQDTLGWTDQQLLERLTAWPNRDQDKAAIKVMATCMAYFKLSSRRFRDMVPLYIRHHLLTAAANTCDEHMERSLMRLARQSGATGAPAAAAKQSRSPSGSPDASTASADAGAEAGEAVAGAEPLSWSSCPAIMALMTGGPLDANKQKLKAELETTRDALQRLLNSITTYHENEA